MWELDCEESWVLKNWCFWTVVLEKTLESPLDCKEIQPVHPKGVLGVHWKDWCWSWNSNTLAISCKELTHWKRLYTGREWGQEEKGMTEDEMAGWHPGLNGLESEWTPWDGDEQRGLACCDSWGRKESDTTERLNWTDINFLHSIYHHFFIVLSLLSFPSLPFLPPSLLSLKRKL